MHDTRYGRKVLAESNDIAAMVEAVTHYVAARIIERERALARIKPAARAVASGVHGRPRRGGWRMVRAFLFGLFAGCVALFAVPVGRRVAAAALDPPTRTLHPPLEGALHNNPEI